MSMLKGKTALVTGSTSGIGLGIAIELARQGAHIVINGFGDVEGPKKQIAAHDVRVEYHGADMSKPAEIEAMMKFAAEKFGGVYRARGDRMEIVESELWSPTRIVLIEFPTFDDALAFLHSDEYEPVKALRHRYAETTAVVVQLS